MNIPFKLALSNTSPHGVLWNPWGATVPNSVDNTILTGLDADLQEKYGLRPPTRNVIVTGYVVVSDTADAKVSLGMYDTVLGAFHEIYPTNATVVAGGGLVDQIFNYCGYLFPLGATLIPVIKYTPVSGSVVITGQVHVEVLQEAGNTPIANIPTASLQDEQNGTLLDEAGLILLQE